MIYNKEEIFAKVSKKHNVNLSKLNTETRFKEDLHADSIDLVEFLIELEDNLNISIPEDKALKFMTIGDVFEFLDELKA